MSSRRYIKVTTVCADATVAFTGSSDSPNAIMLGASASLDATKVYLKDGGVISGSAFTPKEMYHDLWVTKVTTTDAAKAILYVFHQQ